MWLRGSLPHPYVYKLWACNPKDNKQFYLTGEKNNLTDLCCVLYSIQLLGGDY